MKNLIKVPLILFLSSCQAPQFKPMVLCEASFEFNYCRCRCYDLEGPETIDPKLCDIDSEEMAWDEPIEACDGYTGFHIEDWAIELIPKINEKRRYFEDVCK